MQYKKINVELIVVADEADAVVAELNTALDRLEEKHTLFGGGNRTPWNTKEIGTRAYDSRRGNGR
jgi:acyl-CoA hydrolase